MQRKSKILLFTALAGLGIGTIKKIANHEHNQRHPKSYSALSIRKRGQVDDICQMILPSTTDGFSFQLSANRYFRLLKYLSRRYATDVRTASQQLSIPYIETYNLIVALVHQNVLSHSSCDTDYVRQNKVETLIKDLVPLFDQRGTVIPSDFARKVKQTVTRNIF